jgi:Trk K+ transport system NAD-binding subunit
LVAGDRLLVVGTAEKLQAFEKIMVASVDLP